MQENKAEDKAKTAFKCLILMVPESGLEPLRPYDREILSLLCLPIPPLGLGVLVFITREKVEARAGIEPAWTELQSAA